MMVIKKPMDLSTLLTNIDEHKYSTIREFLADADLIWKNALEYNPDSDPLGTLINYSLFFFLSYHKSLKSDKK